MNYNTDGFNERTNFIHNSNDLNRMNKNHAQVDTSFAKMKIKENSSNIKTYCNDSAKFEDNKRYENLNQFDLFNNYKSNDLRKKYKNL